MAAPQLYRKKRIANRRIEHWLSFDTECEPYETIDLVHNPSQVELTDFLEYVNATHPTWAELGQLMTTMHGETNAANLLKNFLDLRFTAEGAFLEPV